MILTTKNNQRIEVKRTDYFEVKGETTINRGCMRWVILACLFFPLVILYFFSGEKVVHVKLNSKSYLVDQFQFQRLVDFMDGN